MTNTQINQDELAAARAILAAADAQTRESVVQAQDYADTAVSALDVDALLTTARAKLLEGTPAASPQKETVEATDPGLINSLYARQSELARMEKNAKAEREKITIFFADLVDAAEKAAGSPVETLTANGVPVFHFKTVITRSLDQAAVKNRFPDIPENAWAYSESITRRRTYA